MAGRILGRQGQLVHFTEGVGPCGVIQGCFGFDAGLQPAEQLPQAGLIGGLADGWNRLDRGVGLVVEPAAWRWRQQGCLPRLPGTEWSGLGLAQ